MGSKAPPSGGSPSVAPQRAYGKHSKRHAQSAPVDQSPASRPSPSPVHPVNVNAVTSAAAFHARSPHLTAFHCQCAQLQAELHRGLRVLHQQQQQQPLATASSAALTSAPSSTFATQEAWLQQLSGDLLALFPTFFSTAVSADDGSHEPTCPFVMMLSVLLPALRKLLQWVVLSRPEWWTPPSSPSFNAALTVSLLATELQLHELLTRVVLEGDRIAAIIHESEEREQDIAVVTHTAATAPPVPVSSRADARSQAASMYVPQIKRISFEFEELHAEIKLAVAELTEAIVDNTELFASRLCRAMVAKDPAKNRYNMSEFADLLVHQLLDPLAERLLKTAMPSVSKAVVLPMLLDRCITVAFEEFIMDSTHMNELMTTQLGKAAMLLRDWALAVEGEYNRLIEPQLHTHPHALSLQLRLSLVDGFRRVELALQAWLHRHGRDANALPDATGGGANGGLDGFVPLVTLKANIESLKTTLRRTIANRTGVTQPTGVGSGHTTMAPNE
ncbi:hypothetical protein ATCC90586_002716 [Pythium insidiosum]|nr:hypothetical protein ATCC90586_002716 [Pythium insidiosum]